MSKGTQVAVAFIGVYLGAIGTMAVLTDEWGLAAMMVGLIAGVVAVSVLVGAWIEAGTP